MITRDKQKGEWPNWWTCARIALCAFAVFLCVYYWDGFSKVLVPVLCAFMSVFIGFGLAYIVNIPTRFFERLLSSRGMKDPSGLAVALAIMSVVGVLLLVIALVLPAFIECVITFVHAFPTYRDYFLYETPVGAWLPENVIDLVKGDNWQVIADRAFSWFQAGAASMLPGAMALASAIGSFCVGFVFALWFLIDKRNLSAFGHRLVCTYISERFDQKLRWAASILDDSYRSYMKAQSLEAFILGSMIALGGTILGLPYAPMIGALIGVLSFIPMVGAFIGAIIGGLMILTVSWQQAIIFAVLFIVIQQIECNFIYVRVVGKAVGLSGFWTLLGLTVGAAIAGIFGSFIAVPTMSALSRIINEDMNRRERERKALEGETLEDEALEAAAE